MTVSTVEILRGLDADGNEYRQLETADHEIAPEVMSIIAAGDVCPRFVSVTGEKQGIPFGTAQLATLLAQCGLLGCDASPVKLYYQKVSSLSGRVADATAEHSVIDGAAARMYITNITAGNRTAVMARGRIVPVSDGTNSPLIRTGSSAISDATPTTAENFVLGPISIQATKIPSCNNLDIALNPAEWDLSDESLIWTTFAAGNTISPVISFVTNDPAMLARHKTAITSSNKLRIHLIRKKPNGDRYADNETQHIRFEVVDGIILVQAVSNSPREYRVEIHAIGDDADGVTGVPFTIAVNSAIALPA